VSFFRIPSPSGDAERAKKGRTILWCDNLGATFLAANPIYHTGTKHIELDVHFIRELVTSKKLTVQFLCSSNQLADVPTKSLSST
jgi:hypothetical protein